MSIEEGRPLFEIEAGSTVSCDYVGVYNEAGLADEQKLEWLKKSLDEIIGGGQRGRLSLVDSHDDEPPYIELGLAPEAGSEQNRTERDLKILQVASRLGGLIEREGGDVLYRPEIIRLGRGPGSPDLFEDKYRRLT